MPKGRLTKKGPLPDEYKLNKMPAKNYPDRTEKNAKKVQKIDDGINSQKKVINLGPEKWKELSQKNKIYI